MQRDTWRTATLAVEIAVMISRLPQADRLRYAQIHRPDWMREADLPSAAYLVYLADRVR